MPTPQEYLLSFDFTSFTSQFNILNRSYTDFGETIHKLTSQVSTDLKGIQEQADNLFQTFSSLGMVSENNFSSFERHLKQTSTYLDDYQKKSSEISQRLKDISNTDISKLSGALGGGQTLQDIINTQALAGSALTSGFLQVGATTDGYSVPVIAASTGMGYAIVGMNAVTSASTATSPGYASTASSILGVFTARLNYPYVAQDIATS